MKVSYINGICVQHDAISNAVRDEIRLLTRRGDMDVRLFGYACDYEEIPFQRVEGVADIAFDPHFQMSELVIFHFGVHYPLFDLLPAVPRKARRLVVFHNITPKERLPRAAWETIDRSLAQMANMVWADHVICDSPTNLATLRAASIRTPANVLPLPVCMQDTPDAKPSFLDGTVRVAFLGRFVMSKGPHDLLAALATIMEGLPKVHVQLDLMGNLAFSDQELLAQLRTTAAALSERYVGRLCVTFHGDVSESRKCALLKDADLFVLPTYHEGFCVPIIEALSSGCRVVTYDNSNTPAITGGLAILVPTGDVDQLATALCDGAAEVLGESWRKTDYQAYISRVQAHVKQFRPPLVGRRFMRFIDHFMREHGPITISRDSV